MKIYPTTLLLTAVFNFILFSQQGIAQKPFKFSSLTFHSSACNGTCPDISINLYSNRSIELSRHLYIGKGRVDSLHSGNFKGKVSDKDFKTIQSYLSRINWDTVKFPDINCCDGAVKTILLSYNGKFKKFKSMTPPQSTKSFIDHITKWGAAVKLAKYNRPIDFEEYE